MEILKTSAALSTKEKYALCLSGHAGKMETIKGQIVEPSAWALYTDVDKKTGELKQILSLMIDGEVFATISATFIDDFMRMVEFFASEGAELPPVKIVSGTSKAGRQFISCTVAD